MTLSGLEGEAPFDEVPSLVGKTLSGRYRIERLLAEGGMGAVYLAEHVHMHKRFAVKVLLPAMTQRPDVVSRFEREAIAAAHIDHPNVAGATDFGKCEDGCFFLVLEYVEGVPLSTVIAEGPIEVGRALHIARQIALALASAHALGIVHRDLKPDNVMLVDRNGNADFAKVLDFGVAKVPVFQPAEPLTLAGKICGTPAYMSPEQALGRAVDARADLYALGIVLFEMLTGVRPFEEEGEHMVSALKVMCDPPAMASANEAVVVPERVEALVLQLLARDPVDRFQSAHEVLDAIDASGCWSAAAHTSPRPALPPPTRRSLFHTLRRKMPNDLLAGMATGLLLFFLGAELFRSSGVVAPADALVTASSDTQPLAPRLEALPPSPDEKALDSQSPATVPSAPSRIAPARSPVPTPRRRTIGLTDFGGRR
jgi:serine/threonine protein kinase